MRVCIFSEFSLPFIGGVQIHLYELSKALAKRQIELHIITSRYGNGPEHEFVEGFEVHRVGFPGAIPRKLRVPGYLFSSSKKAEEINRVGKVDLLHSHEIFFGALAGSFSNLSLRLPHLLTEHIVYSDFFRELYPTFAYLFPKIVERYILRLQYSKVICVSETIMNELNSFGVPPDRLVVIPNGVDLKQFNPDIESQIKSRLGIDDKLLVSFFGRLSSIKGLDHLVRAIPEIVQEVKDVRFLIVGKGPQKPFLMELAKNLNVDDFILFQDSISHACMPQYLRASDLVVLPSLKEGFSLIFLEALACKVPVVTTSACPFSRIVEDQDIGVFVKPGSSRHLARGILSLLVDAALRNKVSSNGFRLVSKKYTWDSVAQRTIQLYNSVL